jgi:predicted nucleotidyltransferase
MAAHDETKGKPGIEFYGGYQVYSESGVDLTLLRRNLERTVEERWENDRQALAFCRALREANAARLGHMVEANRRQVLVDAGEMVRHLTAHQVEFVVVGGQAMRAQGSAYVTEDLDLCYRRTAQNMAALAGALAPLHPSPRTAQAGQPVVVDLTAIQAALSLALTTDLGDIDLLGEVSGLGTYDRVTAQSDELTVFGSKVRVLSLDGLIAAKRAAGRRKDYLHLLELEELKKLREGGQG